MRERQPRHRTLFLIDEAAQLGPFPLLDSAITLARSYGVRVWTFWQDVQQIQSSFPVGWRTLINNCALQAFGVSSRLMARELETIMDCSSEDLLQLGPEEQLLQIGAGGATRSRRLNYLRDPMFAGLFDPNPFYAQPGQARRAPTSNSPADARELHRLSIPVATPNHDVEQPGPCVR